MREKIFSLVMACCIVFSLFAVCVVGISADNASPPGNEALSTDREPDMRYTQTCYIIPDSVNVEMIFWEIAFIDTLTTGATIADAMSAADQQIKTNDELSFPYSTAEINRYFSGCDSDQPCY